MCRAIKVSSTSTISYYLNKLEGSGQIKKSPNKNRALEIVGDDEPDNKKVVSTLLKGVIKGEFSLKALIGLISAVSKGNKLEKHYKNYPSSPEGYQKWKQKAEKLWKKAGSMADCIKDA